MQCPTCKRILDDDVRFCPNDGTPLADTGATQADSTPTGGQASKSRPLELPVVIGGRYRLEELRGGGGMAKVYRAVDLTLEREVAVKLINQELRSEPEFDVRFQREAKIASQLADPHIVVVHDFGLDAEHGPYLVMEYLNGQSLRERLATGGPLPLKAGLQLAGQVVLALVHAHGKGIVHRDIKPDNVFLLNQSGVRLHVRVLDFGIARIYKGDDGKAETITHAGAVLGTPRYMSPEQLAGQPVDARSDIFSTALLLYEALTGQLPYLHGKKLTDLCPEATAAMEELLAQCLKPSPDERPQNAVEVYLRLQELGKASGILLLPPGSLDKLIAARKMNEPTVAYTPKDEGGRRWKRRALIGAVVGVVMLGLAALAKALFFSAPAYPTGLEQLHGVRYGDKRGTDGLMQGLGGSGGRGSLKVDPWKDASTQSRMRPCLRPSDLGYGQDQPVSLDVFYTNDGSVVQFLVGATTIGLLTTNGSAKTNRDIAVGTDVRQVEERYSNEFLEKEPTKHEGRSVTVYRYPFLGLAFEVEAGRVVAMALFQPRE